MTLKVRSSVGNSITNDSTPSFDSPATIVIGDLLVLFIAHNDDFDEPSGWTPPSGWTLEDVIEQTGVGSVDGRGMAYSVFTKTAVAQDVTDQGTTLYYTFTGADAGDDRLYGLFSCYDDAAGTVEYKAGSLAGTFQDGVGGTTSNAPSQAITEDVSLLLVMWTARQGTDEFNIDVNETYSPTGGANATLHHGAWTANAQADMELVAGSAEFDTADNPTGIQVLTHDSCNSDVDFYNASFIIHVVSSGIGPRKAVERLLRTG